MLSDVRSPAAQPVNTEWLKSRATHGKRHKSNYVPSDVSADQWRLGKEILSSRPFQYEFPSHSREEGNLHS